MNRRSIRFRLTAWYAGILVLTFAAVGIGVWAAIRDSINDTVDKELRFRLQAMRDYVEDYLRLLSAETKRQRLLFDMEPPAGALDRTDTAASIPTDADLTVSVGQQ